MEIGRVEAVTVVGSTAGAETVPQLSKTERSFGDVLAGLRGPDPLGIQVLNEQRQRLLSGAKLSPQELITYQIRAGEFGLQVEFVSKVADGILQTARRLQNPQ